MIHPLTQVVLTSTLGESPWRSGKLNLQFLRGNQSPGLVYVESQLLIVNAIQLDAHPAGGAHVRRAVELFRISFNQHRLDPDRRRDADGNVAVVVMVV